MDGKARKSEEKKREEKDGKEKRTEKRKIHAAKQKPFKREHPTFFKGNRL